MQITGTSTSRLIELRKYVITDDFSRQYIIGGNDNTDGVDLVNSNPASQIVYYLGGVKYIDFVSGETSGMTYNIFTPIGINNHLNFNFAPYYKNPNKEKLISNPKISSDVFIVRQNLSAFEKNYRLEYVKYLSDLTTYAGGIYFNIKNNS